MKLCKDTLLILIFGLITLILTLGSVIGWYIGLENGELIKVLAAPAIAALCVLMHKTADKKDSE